MKKKKIRYYIALERTQDPTLLDCNYADTCFTVTLGSVLAGCYTRVPHRSTLYQQVAPPPDSPGVQLVRSWISAMLPTISLNASTASVRLSTLEPSGVSLAVHGASPSSWGCTLSRSSRASKAPASPLQTSVSPDPLVRVIVHPALSGRFWTPQGVPALRSRSIGFSNAICPSPWRKVRHFRVRQNSEWTFPFA